MNNVDLGRLAFITEQSITRRGLFPKYDRHAGFVAFNQLLKEYKRRVTRLEHKRDMWLREWNFAADVNEKLEAELEVLRRIGEDKVILNEQVHALEARMERYQELLEAMARRDKNLDPVWMEQFAKAELPFAESILPACVIAHSRSPRKSLPCGNKVLQAITAFVSSLDDWKG